ncbi:NAD(P)-dependent dehydrogenase (short-subunit alcohol dehydrogenase family) [Lysobacter niastensis]|uniref:NAD(P)-dependent dehydrogenase (Short-subunit alcohol dehydrogenase family) n=1 Tax=Lysobacter niastensis TaxID=380629 RepID=A0ABU1WAB5_9GAMM|nr:SDR family NAD(P)-dependent oxidoreductase [Lysobacter niastensis]MDR7134392.1 NAD(P)-dependent dehydrogenase (short-subunit alcohol dehydrogenase family) [Lysobacter niastensis]
MTRFRTPFDFHSTADQILEGVDLSGRRAIVTGASSGIGIETARALARAGAEVTLAVRNVEAGRNVVNQIVATDDSARLHVRPLDLSDLDSVHTFARGWSGPLHILVNNAGIMATPTLERSAGGWEGQMATNYLGHFALTLRMKEALAAAGNARVVCLSSSGHLLAPVIFGDPHFRFLRYDPLTAYGQSKTACVLMAVEITRRWRDAYGIQANALNPGAIATNLQKHTGGLKTPEARRKTVEQGAATTVLLAGSPLLSSVSGRYFEDCNEAQVVTERPDDYSGVASYALDQVSAERLWEFSVRSLNTSR